MQSVEKRSVGLYFGSFNPVHMGHLIVAQHMLSHENLDEVWFIVSPHNPFKSKKELAAPESRLRMVELAIAGNPDMVAIDIEFSMPVPSYTIDTLDLLRETYPEIQFCLIMGSDNLDEVPDWKEGERILNSMPILVYKRPGHKVLPEDMHPGVRVIDAPSLYISSTHIRNSLELGFSIRYLLPDPVVDYINAHSLYAAQEED